MGIPRASDGLPATCEVRDWVVFGPGVHKGALYTPEMNNRVAPNFERLREHLTPNAKIGHDKQQRLAKSLGFLSVGQVVAVRSAGNGYFALTVKNVPTAVGAEINAGRLNSGSVELLPRIADPERPDRDIEGPVLTGVAFLGEEQPAVKGFDPPRAVFADGTPVPPSADPAPWLAAMADVTVRMAAGAADDPPKFSWFGRSYTAHTICFSEMNMDPKAQLAALGLSPEQIDKVMMICGGGAGGGPGPAGDAPNPAPMGDMTITHEGEDDPMQACAKYADDPNATPEQKMMGAMAKKFADMGKELEETKKNYAALSRFAEEAQKKDEEMKMAAFSAQVESECAKIARKVPPAAMPVVKQTAMGILTAKHFAAESDRIKAFSELFAGYHRLPDNPALAPQMAQPTDPKALAANPSVAVAARVGGTLDMLAPAVAKKLREQAGAA